RSARLQACHGEGRGTAKSDSIMLFFDKIISGSAPVIAQHILRVSNALMQMKGILSFETKPG
ncbi:MAG: hypothetical protein RSD27_10935, partial [Ruthenibacterium sp.]